MHIVIEAVWSLRAANSTWLVRAVLSEISGRDSRLRRDNPAPYAARLISALLCLPITPRASGIVVRPPTRARANPAALR